MRVRKSSYFELFSFPLNSRAVINSACGKGRQLKANPLVTYFYLPATIMTMHWPFSMCMVDVVLQKVWYVLFVEQASLIAGLRTWERKAD